VIRIVKLYTPDIFLAKHEINQHLSYERGKRISVFNLLLRGGTVFKLISSSPSYSQIKYVYSPLVLWGN